MMIFYCFCSHPVAIIGRESGDKLGETMISVEDFKATKYGGPGSKLPIDIVPQCLLSPSEHVIPVETEREEKLKGSLETHEPEELGYQEFGGKQQPSKVRNR